MFFESYISHRYNTDLDFIIRSGYSFSQQRTRQTDSTYDM